MGYKIIVVDDDIDSHKLIGLMLYRQGHEPISYTDIQAFAFIQAANEGRIDKNAMPDLFILDIMMPRYDGYELLRLIRESDALQSIPIMMFTGKTLVDDKVKAFEMGADGYLTKPTHPAELAQRVRELVEEHQWRSSEA